MSDLNYLVRIPKKEVENPPLLILLHGYGSNEQDLFSFSEELPDEFLIISAQAPINMQPGSYAWYDINFDRINGKFSDLKQAKESIDKIAVFIDLIKEKYKTDTAQTFLLGFSQGAILGYAIALSYPKKVQRLVAMSGYLNIEIAVDDFKNNDFSSLKIFASHGTVDQVIPVEWARKSIPLIENLGISIVYKEYPVGHGVSPQNFFDLNNWLQS